MGASIEEILGSHRTGRAVVMGVLNVTPDSFSDGGDFLQPSDAVAHAARMVEAGADIIDIGAESTRPGAEPLSAGEQIERLGPILPAIASGAMVSIDTTSAAVAAFAIEAGAAIINDTSAGLDDAEMLPLAARSGKPIVLMHRPGAPQTMQSLARYDDVVAEVKDHLAERLAAAMRAGVKREKVILDPGIGFGKTAEHNLTLLAGVAKLCELGRPVLIGASRKRFIGLLSGDAAPSRRLGGTIAAHLLAWQRGASIFRVHDVFPMVQALAIAGAIRKAE
ncbi:MAG: dihydropteroate synthase [Phycisphaerae bacterium]|jgi:dihydropteroate synthase